jgi:prepilin-type N-terminal cleavage/methylation domain-containing protein
MKIFARAFTMVELLASIAIIAVIAALVFAFVGNYVDYARLTAVRHTVAVLNESLNEYRALGGLRKGYPMPGSSGSTLNSATLTTAAVEGLQKGFDNHGKTVGFVRPNQTFNTSYVASTGAGASFRFVVNEVALVPDNGATPAKSAQSAVSITASAASVQTGTAVTLTASGGSGTGAYTWSATGGTLSATTGASVEIVFQSAGTYTVSVYRAADANYEASEVATVSILDTPSTWTVSTLSPSVFQASILEVDGNGVIYVAYYNSSSSTIYKIVSENAISSFASGLNYPFGFGMDGGNNLYVAVHFGNNAILKFTPKGANSTVVSSGLNMPYDVAVDSAGQTLYVADTWNYQIKKITGGTSTTLASTTARVGSINADSAGNVYWIDGTDLKKYTNGTITTTALGFSCGDFALDEVGNIYFADYDHTIKKLSASGVFTTIAGVSGASGLVNGAGDVAQFNQPRGIWVNPSGTLIYVADYGNNAVRKIVGQ